MARIAGVDLPRDKRIVIGLTYIYGIGNTTAKKILAEADILLYTALTRLFNCHEIANLLFRLFKLFLVLKGVKIRMIEFEKPKIHKIEEGQDYGKFVVEPLERGYGTTLGNSLRCHDPLHP